ncbi:MAG: hypothetical protein RLZZ127_2727 [Planctomycetota bacterium]|jgi:hypothetical protein
MRRAGIPLVFALVCTLPGADTLELFRDAQATGDPGLVAVGLLASS